MFKPAVPVMFRILKLSGNILHGGYDKNPISPIGVV